jgi:hypothetical protein
MSFMPFTHQRVDVNTNKKSRVERNCLLRSSEDFRQVFINEDTTIIFV